MAGISLIELIMFIVIVGAALAGVMSVLNLTTRHSADPQLRKQALAIAEAVLEEAMLMPFTDCDPDGYDALATPPTCVQAEAAGPEAAYASQPADETRGSLTTPFDNVNDYHNFVLAGGGHDIGNSAAVTVPAGYSAAVTVTPEAYGPVGSTVPVSDALRIRVVVSYNNGNDNITLDGYRAKYAPAFMP